ncbi:MAG: hypothetical protein WBM90_09150, partial [Acidimicrobiia bacterium]
LNSVTGYTGACQVHRAELKRLHGSWLEAEDEARKACMELERFQITDYLGGAHYEIGEIRRRMGDLDSADLEFQRAYEQGHDAQPGRSLLLLDRGQTEAALRSIQAAYKWHEEDDNQSTERGPSRARLLPALIEIALASGELELAERSVQQLDVIAGAYESDVWKAAAESCRGALYLSRGEADAAVEYLDRAWRMWRQMDLPYEMARARALLGEADRAAGDEVAATAEFKAAHATFQKLGAVGDVSRLKTLIGVEGDDEESSITRVTRTFMFTDLVTSTDLIGLIGDSAWQDLLKWHDRTLRSAIDSAGGEVVRHTGDGFFASFADTRSGLDCAVDIQRRLAAHRKQAGFAPNLRIGLHRTEANRAGSDYSGGGIHLAARIGDHGSADEIVISSDTLGEGGTIPYPATPPVPVELKGIKDPVMLQNIDWR